MVAHQSWSRELDDLAGLLREETDANQASSSDTAQPGRTYATAHRLYVKYAPLLRRLDACAALCTHPQLAVDLDAAVEAVATRLVQLRAVLVHWAPLNPELVRGSSGGPERPLPWEYVALDGDTLTPPAPLTELALIVPRALRRRPRRRGGSGGDAVSVPRGAAAAIDAATDAGASGGAAPPDADDAHLLGAALTATAVARGYGGGGAAAEAAAVAAAEEALAANAAALDAALPSLEAALLATEGPIVRDDMRAQRQAWLLGRVAAATAAAAAAAAAGGDAAAGAPAPGLPVDLSDFYAPPPEAADDAPAASTTARGASSKGGKTQPPARGQSAGAKAGSTAGSKKGGAAATAAGSAPDTAGGSPPPPPFTGPSPWLVQLAALLRTHDARWAARGAAAPAAGRQDALPPPPPLPWEDDLALDALRPGVVERLRREVDAEVLDQLANVRLLAGAPPSGAGAAGKAGVGKSAPAQAAGATVKALGSGTGTAGSGGKVKPLPGARACAGLDAAAMAARLTELHLVDAAPARAGGDVTDPTGAHGPTLASFVGDANPGAARYAATDTPAQRHPTLGHWLPLDPDPAQLRDAVVAHAVLPLLSASLRREAHAFCAAHGIGGGRAPRSLLLYGPPGCGKSHLVRAAVRAAGAAVIDISVARLEAAAALAASAAAAPPQIPSSADDESASGAARLPDAAVATGAPVTAPPSTDLDALGILHMAFEVAKAGALGPCIILLDGVECAVPAPSGGGGATTTKKAAAPGVLKSPPTPAATTAPVAAAFPGGAELSARFKKELATYVASVTAEHAVLVIGVTNAPWRADAKALAAVFDRALHVPKPDYATRRAVLRHAVAQAVLRSGPSLPPTPATRGSAGDAGAHTEAPASPTTAGDDVAATASAPALAGGRRTSAELAADALQCFPCGELAWATAGWPTGALCALVADALPPSRCAAMDERPVTDADFADAVAARQPPPGGSDRDAADAFRAFTDVITGLGERRREGAAAAATTAAKPAGKRGAPQAAKKGK